MDTAGIDLDAVQKKVETVVPLTLAENFAYLVKVIGTDPDLAMEIITRSYEDVIIVPKKTKNQDL